MEFQARVRRFSDSLACSLPIGPKALEILRDSLPPLNDRLEPVNNGGWLQWPLGQFIADHGLDHIEESFQAMTELTKRFTSEFAVRPFVERFPTTTFERLLALTSDPNPHVRRWCTEGVRPLLPWGKKLKSLIDDPSPIWPILEALKNDSSLYVRKSIANNLNDLSKSHPGLVLERCRAWLGNPTPERQWIARHGLRTLIKSGQPEALSLLGFNPPRDLRVDLQLEPQTLAIGQSVQMTVELSSSSTDCQQLQVDYAVDYVRQHGKRSIKVFKGKQVELRDGHPVVIQKSHSMRKTTIRALYPGSHRIEIQVNGMTLAQARFELVEAPW